MISTHPSHHAVRSSNRSSDLERGRDPPKARRRTRTKRHHRRHRIRLPGVPPVEHARHSPNSFNFGSARCAFCRRPGAGARAPRAGPDLGLAGRFGCAARPVDGAAAGPLEGRGGLREPWFLKARRPGPPGGRNVRGKNLFRWKFLRCSDHFNEAAPSRIRAVHCHVCCKKIWDSETPTGEGGDPLALRRWCEAGSLS